MIEQKNLEPMRRFEGYLDKWKKLVLGAATSKIGDGLHGTPKYKEEGKVFFINGNNLINGKIVFNEDTKRVSEDEQSNDDKTLCVNTILMSINGTIGNLAWYHGEKLMLGKSVAYIQIKNNYNKRFIYSYLQTSKVNKYFIDSLTGSTIKNLGLKAIRDTILYVSCKEEQQKIGQFFKHLDDMIALQQRKIDKTKALKSAYLAEMFPTEGERVPKRRFEGFTDEWEVKALSDIVTDISDGDWILKEHTFDEGKYRIIQTGNLGIRRYIDRIKNAKYFHEEDFNQLKANEIFPGDILISRLAEPAGRTIILPDTGLRMVTSVDVTIIRPDKKFNSMFFMTQMNTEEVLNKINTEVTGTTHKRISRKNLERIELIAPEVYEQEKIGSFFKKIDDTITTHQQKLDKLKATKQAYLHEMFV